MRKETMSNRKINIDMRNAMIALRQINIAYRRFNIGMRKESMINRKINIGMRNAMIGLCWVTGYSHYHSFVATSFLVTALSQLKPIKRRFILYISNSCRVH
jgi:hypothetical protein